MPVGTCFAIIVLGLLVGGVLVVLAFLGGMKWNDDMGKSSDGC